MFGVDPYLDKTSNGYMKWTSSTPSTVKNSGEDLHLSTYDTAISNAVIWEPFIARTFKYIFRGVTYSLGAYDE